MGAADNAARVGGIPPLQGDVLPSAAVPAAAELARREDVILFFAMMVPISAVCIHYTPYVHKQCAALESTTSGGQVRAPDAVRLSPRADTESAWQIVAKAKWLWIPKVLGSLHDGLLHPVANFVVQDFFARRRAGYGDLHCELTPDEPHCREAVMDAAHVSMVLGCIGTLISVLIGPAIGIFSDHMGRRHILVISTIAVFISELFFVLNVQYGTSLYIHLCLSPLGKLPVEPVWFAFAIDVISNPTMTGPCLVTLGAIGAMTSLVAMLIGYFMSMELAVLGAFACSVLSTVSQIFFLPESLPPDRRRSYDHEKGAKLSKMIHAALPWNGFGIMFRTAALSRMSILCIVTGLMDSGLMSCVSAFIGKYMFVDKAASYVVGISQAASAIVWQGAIGLMTHGMSEVLVLLWIRLLVLFLVNGVLLLARDTWQLSAWNLALAGVPAVLATTFAALSSRLVGEHEQGEMRAASTTIITVSQGLGPLIFTPIFESTNQGTARTTGSNLFVVVGTLVAAAVLSGLVTLPHALARGEGGHPNSARKEPCHAKAD